VAVRRRAEADETEVYVGEAREELVERRGVVVAGEAEDARVAESGRLPREAADDPQGTDKGPAETDKLPK
jgi:hypothetical protein